MNKPFVEQLLKRVKANKVNMNNWMEDENGDFTLYFEDFIVAPEQYFCGTTACCAGHACLVDVERTKQAVEEMVERGFLRSTIGWDDVAQHLMGISATEASNLFYSFWPDEYLEMGDKAGLIAILKRGLKEDSFEFVLERW